MKIGRIERPSNRQTDIVTRSQVVAHVGNLGKMRRKHVECEPGVMKSTFYRVHWLRVWYHKCILKWNEKVSRKWAYTFNQVSKIFTGKMGKIG